MPIDTSIYGQIQPPKLESPLNALAQVAQVQHAQSQNRLADLMLTEKQRESDTNNALSEAYKGALGSDGKIDRAKLFADVAQRGAGAKLPALQKTFAEQDKAQADLSKSQLDAAKNRIELAGQAFGYVKANPTVENANAALDYLGQSGVFTPEQVALHKSKVAENPGQVAQLADMAYRTALSAKDQLAKYETRNTGGATDTIQIDPVTGKTVVVNSVRNTVSPDAALSASTQRRAQDMTDARAREQIAAGRIPSGYRMKADGTGLEPIPGGPAEKDKAPTEFQGKSAAFGARAEAADKILAGLEGKYSPAKVNAKQGAENAPLVGGLVGPMTNKYVLSAEDQKAEQAQRDFVNAVLRQESGAAISAPEFENAKKQYFPQPGDGPEVIAQKAANRRLAIQGFKNNAGKAFAGAQAPSAGGWSIVEVK